MAAEDSERLLKQNQEIDHFLCRALRGEPEPWGALGPVAEAEFLARCRHHGVAGLLFQGMRSGSGWPAWPPAVRQALEQAGMGGVARDLLSRHHLERLLQELDARDLPCLLLKGEALATGVYPTPGTRTRSDIDLFIRIADILAVKGLVEAMGYRVFPPIYKSHQFTVMRPDDTSGTVRFDIHWRILNSPRFARALTFEEAWRSSLPVPGMPGARMLDAIDALLVACMHRSGSDRHDPDRLIWLHDIYALTAGLSVDGWVRFARKAVECGVQEACLDGVRVSGACFGFEPPAEIADILSAADFPEDKRRPRFSGSHVGLLLDDWRELSSARARIGLLREFAFPAAGQLLHRYGKKSRLWLPVLYVRRAGRGLLDKLMLK